jgi:ABC-type multidrug transport system fused ATPase/permease subunit
VAGRTRAAWRRVSPFFGASRAKIIGLAAAAVAAGLVEAALLALVASAAGALSIGESRVDADLGPLSINTELRVLLGVGIGLAVVRGALHLLLAYLPANMSAIANANLRKSLFDAFANTSWSVQASERDGHFQSLMGLHVGSVSRAIITLGTAISSSLMFLTMLASAFILSVTTAVVIIVTSAGLFILLRPLSRRLRGYAKQLSHESVEYAKGMQEVVLMAEEMQVFGASDPYRETMYRLIDRVRLPLLRTRFLSRAIPALYQSVAFLLLILALGVVSLTGANGIAALGAVVLILIRSLTYGQQIQTAVTKMDELLPFMHRLRDAIDHYRANPQQDGDSSMPTVLRLGMDDVHFSYVPGVEVLAGITFEARMGEAIGIVGPSGAGKSSLVQLLLRLRDPGSGSVHVNGQDARSLRRAEWQQQVAYVPQTSQLIWGTIADNIRFYRPHLSDDDVETAARRAQIHDEVMSWPKGYQTNIGQRASAVSGGQRQRLCLARALAGKPDVLVLDEPTSALDVKSEMLIQETLQKLKGDVILFLVAHRLSTLSVCNRVMVIVGGKLQAIDKPTELLAKNDFYREVTEITRQQSVV